MLGHSSVHSILQWDLEKSKRYVTVYNNIDSILHRIFFFKNYQKTQKSKKKYIKKKKIEIKKSEPVVTLVYMSFTCTNGNVSIV